MQLDVEVSPPAFVLNPNYPLGTAHTSPSSCPQLFHTVQPEIRSSDILSSVNFGLVTDRRTDRKRGIRAHRA